MYGDSKMHVKPIVSVMNRMWLSCELVLTQRPVALLSGVEGVADACTTGVVTVAVFAGAITRDVHFSGCVYRVYIQYIQY